MSQTPLPTDITFQQDWDKLLPSRQVSEIQNAVHRKLRRTTPDDGQVTEMTYRPVPQSYLRIRWSGTGPGATVYSVELLEDPSLRAFETPDEDDFR